MLLVRFDSCKCLQKRNCSSVLTILSCKFLLRAKQRDQEGPCLSREAQHKHCKPNSTDPLLLFHHLRSGGLLDTTFNSRVMSLFYSKVVLLKPEIFLLFSPASPAVHQCPNVMLYQQTHFRCVYLRCVQTRH